MNPDSIFYQLDIEIQNDMLSKVPDNCNDPNVYYEAFIQYLTSRSHLNKTFDNFAYRLSIEQHHFKTCESFVDTMHKLQKNKDVTGRMKPLLQQEFYSFILENAEQIEKVYQEVQKSSIEFTMTFFGWKTLYRSYLIQTHEGIAERLDHLWFRIALFLHTSNFEKVKQTFGMLRSGEGIHATPTLFHAGMVHAQMASCFDGETLVNTLRGPVPIKDVQLGDEVVTHLGRVKKVIQTHKNKLGDRKMYEVDIIKTNKFLVTEDHQLYVYNKESKIRDWKQVKDLTCKDYIMIPNRRELVSYSSIKNFAMLDKIPLELYSSSKTEISKWLQILLKNDQKEFLTSSKSLINEIYNLCKLHNIDCGAVTKTNDTQFKISFDVTQEENLIEIDGFKFLSFQSRKLVDYKEDYVYTLGVEDDHSYSIEGIIAQNCFLIGTEDSVQGIFKTISDAAIISKYAGGIGIHISNIRAKKSYIYGTNGYSNGIMPMLRVYNDTSRYIDQCFDAQTRVVTSRGLIPISEIKPLEDSVLTKDGAFHKVQKKLVHVVEKDIVRVLVQTPWKEKVKTIMTSGHDMYWFDPVSQQKLFVPIGKASFGFQPVYVQPKSLSVAFYEEECFVLGYLYANLSYTSPMKWKLSPPNDATLIERVTNFLERYYPKCFSLEPRPGNQEKINIVIDLKKFESTVPSLIDWHSLTPGDFPMELALGPLPKIEKFLQGYQYCKTELDKESPKVQFLKYRLGIFENNAKILAMETKEESKTLLYDLEVDKEHNYQTVLGLAHNGGGKRKGAFAMYIEPWHSDIYDFIMARRNTGNEEERARDLFFGLWVPDEFMRRVESDDDWYLMSENLSPGLSKVWGKKFDDLYNSYITQGKYTEKVKARKLWYEILKSQIETGTPYILYKDTCNRCSNQQNLGTIRSSNLCCEIIEYSDSKEYAVCNLASICLSSCLKQKEISDITFWIFGKEGCFYCDLLKSLLTKKGVTFSYTTNKEHLSSLELPRLAGKTSYPIVYQGNTHIGGFKETWEIYLRPDFDFEKLGKIVGTLVENLNIIIDKNAYPLEECRRSNFKNRPIGIGVQGLADVFMAMLEPYDSEFSRNLNRRIFETMYYYALKKSHELAMLYGPYDSFEGSPLSRGKFHYEFMSVFNETKHLTCGYNWELLRSNIVRDGTRNSLLLAPMPTASTSQIMGNTESFEPLTSNFYVRRTLAGEFYVMNKHLRYILECANAWKEHNIQALILDKGSILNMDIPKSIKDVFKTVWEIPQKHLIEMAADRQMFIDQSQSFNIYMSKGDLATLTKIHFYGWKKELKTGSYYLRTRAAISSQNFSMDPEKEACTSCSA